MAQFIFGYDSSIRVRRNDAADAAAATNNQQQKRTQAVDRIFQLIDGKEKTDRIKLIEMQLKYR